MQTIHRTETGTIFETTLHTELRPQLKHLQLIVTQCKIYGP